MHTNESVINESAAVQELFEAVEDMSRKAEKAAFELTEKEQALEDEINQKIADMEAAQEEGSSENETAKSIKEIAKEKLGLVNSDEILFKEENQD